jgi:NADH dehydrogenase/NADH:ubiquinone oxidoreductase subunit G
MGALTLKSFPFELRGWDVENFESMDITDGFCSKIRVYLYKNRIVQIEPEYDSQTKRSWLSDKGRQFFDGFYHEWEFLEKEQQNEQKFSLKKILKSLCLFVYFYDYNIKSATSQKTYIVFDNVSFDVLCLLDILKQSFSFLNVKKATKSSLNDDNEHNFKLNVAKQTARWNTSTLCLLISTNPRYDGYYLNLNIRQRILKGNFKCLCLGSFLDMTYPVSFLGSNINLFTKLAEGAHLNCQDFTKAKSPFVVFNSEFFSRKDSQVFEKINKIFSGLNNLPLKWYSTNTLTLNAGDASASFLGTFDVFSFNDLKNVKSLFLLNVNENHLKNLQQKISLKLLNTKSKNDISPFSHKSLVINQNYKKDSAINFIRGLNHEKSNFIANTIFFENEEIFLNTEGKIISTEKLIFRKKTRNSWQVLRKILKLLNQKATLIKNGKDGSLVFFNSDNLAQYKNFIHFTYYATKNLRAFMHLLSQNSTNFYLTTNSFKKSTTYIKKTKINYWLNDFFNGGKDAYSGSSLTLQKCAFNTKSDLTNFF